MYMILHESGEYSDYSIRMLGYVTEETKAQEIVTKKNEELAKLFALKEKYDDFIVEHDANHPFKWSDSTSLEAEEEEMKAYETWRLEKQQAINNWFKENNLTEQTSRQMQFLYGDRYLYRKIEEYKE